MIIILEPQKDTYITNLKTVKNDGAKANVGQAATIDFFKLYNENKNAHSWAVFKFTDLIPDSNTLVLTDVNNVTKTFEFDTDVCTVAVICVVLLIVVDADICSVPSFPINVAVAPLLKFVPVITKLNPDAICVSKILLLFTLVTVGGVSIGVHDVPL